MRRILVLISEPPYGTETAFAGLRSAIALKAMGENATVDLVCWGEGVYNCLPGQNSEESLGMPSHLEALDDLGFLGCKVWVVQEDWARFCLGESQGVDLPEGVEPIHEEQMAALIRNYEGLLSF